LPAILLGAQSLLPLSGPVLSKSHTLSLHDALPISRPSSAASRRRQASNCSAAAPRSLCLRARRMTARCHSSSSGSSSSAAVASRSEEHTSELQSRENLVCRLLLE